MSSFKQRVNSAYRYGSEHVVTVALVNLGVGIVLTALVAFGFYRTGAVEQRVTRVEHSACQRATESPDDTKAVEECAEIRAKVARSEPIENPCISAQRVTGRRGRNCPRFYIALPSARGGSMPTTGLGEESVLLPDSEPEQAPVHHGDHTAPVPHSPVKQPAHQTKPQGGPPASMPAPASATADPTPASSATPAQNESTPSPSSGPLRETVKGIGDTVEETLGGVGRLPCELLGSC